MTLETILLQFVLPILGTLLGTGGAITIILNRKKHKAETAKIDIESQSVSIENSIKLEALATQRFVEETKRYSRVMEMLDSAEKSLMEARQELRKVKKELDLVRDELEKERAYNKILDKALRSNSLCVPPRPKH